MVHPDAVGLTVAWMHATQADVLSGLPYQVMETPAERLSLPFIRLGMRATLPCWLNRWLRLPALAVAVGQFLTFRRSVYRHMGGHKAVRGEVIEDMALARLAARHGQTWRHADLRRRMTTRMYPSWAEIRQGFLKNLPPFSVGRPPLLFGLAAVVERLRFVLGGPDARPLLGEPFPGFGPQRAWLNIALSLILWTLFGREDDHQCPLTITAFTYPALLSFYRYRRGGENVWKDRVLRA